MAKDDRPGLTVDASGNPAIDPTANVLETVAREVRRLDDLREASERRVSDLVQVHSEIDRQTATHLAETASMRADYEEKLRDAERGRIDAIRALDVSNVERAQAVSQAQAATLAAQVATSAETLRAQVEATRAQTATALEQALQPIKTDVADLRRVQYEQQGQRAGVVETRTGTQVTFGQIVAALAVVFAFLSIAAGVVIALTR